ncbi:MAG: N-acetyltransferase family protein, partial [Caproiciproducens sp.]|nr:N-acetyltransferase family protein [Caproiciproducens sp.]
MELQIREMEEADWNDVCRIYQHGIDTNLATIATHCPTYTDWDRAHFKKCRYVITEDGTVVGWAVLSPVSSKCAYSGVAEISIYI